MPRFVRITASVYGTPLGPGSTEKEVAPSYSFEAAQFEVQLVSKIKVESDFSNGVTIKRTNRQQVVHVFSSSDFDVRVLLP